MRCTKPRTVGFRADGKTICWSPRNYSKEYPTFQLPCGKCISCRLEYARQWAIRCVHEAQMHEKNSFITLTYSDEHLINPKLNYTDFQKFMKRLRKLTDAQIGVFVTGEYGDKRKRPHWHAIIFNWRPPDLIYKYSNDRGDKVYSSTTLDRLWGKGITEIGQVTFESAGYCARYAAKKLVHGHDQTHEYDPISKKSSKHAIGKKWLETFWQSDCFNNGFIILEDGTKCGIPRYYEKWLQKNQPDAWVRYVTQLKFERIKKLEEKEIKEELEEKKQNLDRTARGKKLLVSKNKAREIILEQKFNKLQEKLKL